MPKLLLVDDERDFRESLSRRLKLRGFDNLAVGSGDEAVKVIRTDHDVDVVLLDRKMPGMSGEETLREIKKFRPEIQVVLLTAFGSLSSATEAGRLDAYQYLEKPVDLEQLVRVVNDAREETVHARSRYEIPVRRKPTLGAWLMGGHNSRPAFILLGLVLMAFLIAIPAPGRMLELLSAKKTDPSSAGPAPDANLGYADYLKMKSGETIAEHYSKKYRLQKKVPGGGGGGITRPLTSRETAFRAKVMLGVLVVAALFWASGAVPVGVTALFVAASMYVFGVLRPDDIAQAFAKDAVIFIFGVLAMSKAITKTGLDRRLGILLLAPARNLGLLMFAFLPLLAVACSFVSEHALIAFLMPLFVMVYVGSLRGTEIRRDRALMVLFVLSLCYVANIGGPGSPAAGGRNAVMIGILADYGMAPTFGQWVKYGLPFVPVMALVLGAYFYVAFKRKIKVRSLDVSGIVRDASRRIGPMTRHEYFTAAVLVLVIVLWITASGFLGMGGPVILGLVALNLFRVLTWRDIIAIPWEVVFLYAAASAIGKGLAVTGGALYLADGFVGMLPDFMLQGVGLAMAASLFTGLATNFMSDGATVAAIGPITVPMAKVAAVHPWAVGFATAFASSFAHMLIIGTPNNAIAYAMAKDPFTGEQLVTLGDFLKYGAVAVLLSLAVLWLWVFLGYWQWIGFPGV
jgi:sodium-dependent dicarboxylate transporter 2/3/5